MRSRISETDDVPTATLPGGEPTERGLRVNDTALQPGDYVWWVADTGRIEYGEVIRHFCLGCLFPRRQAVKTEDDRIAHPKVSSLRRLEADGYPI